MATVFPKRLSGYAERMLITKRDIEVFKLLNRYRWLRANFIHRLVGGSKQNVHRRLGSLFHQGLLGRPEQQKQSYNARYAPRIYELTPKSKKLLEDLGVKIIEWKGSKTFWHQLMISDVVASFELAARFKGLPFKTKQELIGDAPLSLPAKISYKFKTHSEESEKNVQPDGLFQIGNTAFLLEADRGTETILPSTLSHSSFLRKLLQYQSVFENRAFQEAWGITSIVVLYIFTSHDHCKNVMACREELGKSRYQLFKAFPILGSWEKHPEPLIHVLDDGWERVGHEPLNLGKDIHGYAKVA